MDKDLKEYWKLFMPVAMRVFERESQIRHAKTKELYGISMIHFKYLFALDAGEHTLGGLSDCLFFDKANTTRAIRYLKDRGYVYDDRPCEDSRKYNIFLTDKGKEIVNDLKKDLDQTLDMLLEGVSNEEMSIYIQVVNKMCQNVDNDGKYTQTMEYLRKTVDNHGSSEQISDHSS
jgi:DNA-binding MarR family transcriptional regulator